MWLVRNFSVASSENGIVIMERLLPILWPARCSGCNAFVAEGNAFCSRCEETLVPLGPRCPGCAMPAEGGCLCGGCRRAPFPFAGAFAELAYGGALTQSILRFKHGGHRHLARPLGTYLTPLVTAAVGQGAEIVCPVPLHPRRLRRRGYNQVTELLRVARQRLQGEQCPRLIGDALSRVEDTPTLRRQTAAHRGQIVANAFVVHRPQAIVGQCVLVVDDVMTTGATLSECARTLLTAGARKVLVAALARAL